MKKFCVILLTVALLVAVSVWPASAEGTVNVYIDGPSQIEAGTTLLPVSLYVNGDVAVGGAQGTLLFNANEVEYAGVTLRSDVTALGNTEAVSVNVNADVGKLTFVLTSNVTGGNAPMDAWMTVNFRLKDTAIGSTTSVQLHGADLVLSDMTGDNELFADVALTMAAVNTRVIADTEEAVNMKGATIRTSTELQGLRFESERAASVNVDMSKLTEVGVVMFPTALLYDGQELTKETVGKQGTVPAVASTTDTDKLELIKNGEKLYATLSNGTTHGRANVAITARSYMVVDGVTYYSHNDVAGTSVSDGIASKTLVGVAQSIAKTQIANATAAGKTLDTASVDALLDKTAVFADAEVTALLTFCCENIAYL